jgi:AraC-like DNA-binding protein
MLTQQAQRSRQIVDRIENVARAQMGEPLRIADLCKSVAVSQRRLRSAFHLVHGTAPHRYLRALRMTEARNALLSPASPSATVTQIATDFGFLELGRFAVEYRQAFGECPSDTLRRALAERNDARTAYYPAGTLQLCLSSNLPCLQQRHKVPQGGAIRNGHRRSQDRISLARSLS